MNQLRTDLLHQKCQTVEPDKQSAELRQVSSSWWRQRASRRRWTSRRRWGWSLWTWRWGWRRDRSTSSCCKASARCADGSHSLEIFWNEENQQEYSFTKITNFDSSLELIFPVDWNQCHLDRELFLQRFLLTELIQHLRLERQQNLGSSRRRPPTPSRSPSLARSTAAWKKCPAIWKRSGPETRSVQKLSPENCSIIPTRK